MEIHLARGQDQLGVFALEEVRRKFATGEFRSTDLAWMEGQTSWQPLGSLEFLAPPVPPARSETAPPPIPATSSPAPPASGAMRGPHVLPPTSALAISSMVCGILSIVFLPFIMAFPAVICGHMARGEIRRSAGRLGGGGMAIAGLIMGYLNFAFVALLVGIFAVAVAAGFAIPLFSERHEQGKQTQLISEARQVAVACRQYASEHEDKFPPQLDDLVPQYLPDRTPLDHLSGRGLQYFGGSLKEDPPGKLLFTCTEADKRGRRIAAFVDGSVNGSYKPESSLPEHKVTR